VLFDGALVPAEAFSYPWPNQGAVRNLAYTRTLPLRQNLGQFLSRYAPALITDGLQSVSLRHQTAVAAEASSLLGWIKKGLARSGADLNTIAFTVEPGLAAGSFELQFHYADPKKTFHWRADLQKNEAVFAGDLGTGRTTLTVAALLLNAEQMLAEAMFF
jgi:ribosomal protein L11 methylase PrmA